jgi:nucleoside-diphosphate-sugar epimerase
MDLTEQTVDDRNLPTCLIAGCGYVGARLAHRLAVNRRVLGLVRSSGSATALQAGGIETLVLDLDGGGRPADMLAPVAPDSAIAYLAPPPDSGDSDPRLAAFLAALGEARPAVLLYMSTTGVYGDTGGAVVTESSPLLPGSDRARRRVSAEATALQWSAERNVRCVILRVPGIYGPHRLPLERLERAEPAIRPEDAGPGNRIHVDDLVSACVAALDGRASGVFNVTDGDTASTTHYLLVTAELAGLPPPELIPLAEAQRRISPGMLAFLNEARRVDNRRMREELGVKPAYADMRAGVAASLQEMRASGRR